MTVCPEQETAGGLPGLACGGHDGLGDDLGRCSVTESGRAEMALGLYPEDTGETVEGVCSFHGCCLFLFLQQ